MKNSLKYLDLWQKKRNELPVDDAPQAGWLEMQTLLDQHLPNPLLHKAASGSKAAKGSKVLKALKVVKAIKSSSLLFISLTAAAASVCVLGYIAKTKQQQQQDPHKKHKSAITTDSLSNRSVADSLNLTDSTSYRNDSLSALKPSTIVTDTGMENSNPVTALLNNKNTSASISRTDSGTTNGNNKNANAFTGLNNPNAIIAATGNRLAKTNNQFLSNSSKIGLQPGLIINSRNSQSSGRLNIVLEPASNGTQIQHLTNGENNALTDFRNPPPSNLFLNFDKTAGQYTNMNTIRVNKPVNSRNNHKIKNIKTGSNKTSTPLNLNIDWGILAGVNSSGSFTAKSQNANIYGGLPADIYLGLFATHHFNDKWAVNMQVKALTPQNLNGSYTHVNDSKVDSGQTIGVTDSRKAYFVSVPVHLVYKLNKNISLKGGPVINIPVKQVNGLTSLQPASISLDTPYYAATVNKLNATKYDQKINLGLSGGVSIQYNRFIFEATYLKSLSGYHVVSDYGSYKTNKGTLQITLGLQLNRLKNQ